MHGSTIGVAGDVTVAAIDVDAGITVVAVEVDAGITFMGAMVVEVVAVDVATGAFDAGRIVTAAVDGAAVVAANATVGVDADVTVLAGLSCTASAMTVTIAAEPTAAPTTRRCTVASRRIDFPTDRRAPAPADSNRTGSGAEPAGFTCPPRGAPQPGDS